MQQITDQALKNLYPFKSNFFTIGSHRIHYVDEGQGEVVLLVHGNPTWSFYYRNVINSLKDKYRVIAIDHLGHGLSDRPQGKNIDLKTHIANLSALIDHLQIDSFRMMVHDWGGAIGFGVATERPELVRQIVILNTAAFHIDRIPWQINLCKAPILGPFIVKYFNAFAWPATFMTTTKPLSSQVKKGYLYPYPNARSRKGISDFVQDIPMQKDHPTFGVLKQIENNLSSITCPKLILWGGADFCFNDHFYNRWREIYPDADFKYYPHAGHYVLEDESQDVIERVEHFFEQADHERSRANIQ